MTQTRLDTILSKHNVTPQDFGLPPDHTDWRAHQLETVLQWLDWHNVDSDTRITEAPTGSGKSVYPICQGVLGRSVMVTETKNLQDAYGKQYGAAVLYGRGNYACVHPKADSDTKCDECFFAEKGMHKCPYSQDCEYLIAKHVASTASTAVVNYAYWLTAQRYKDTGIVSLTLDEAHLLDNIVLSWSGCKVDDKDRQAWDLPQFPKYPKGLGRPADLEHIADWLKSSVSKLSETAPGLQRQAELGNETAKKRLKACESLKRKLAAVLEAIEAVQSAWFVRSGPGQCWRNGRPLPGIIIKPLTPRYHYKRLFVPRPGSEQHHWHTYAMSATIGGVETFASNLGILKPVSTVVPDQYTPEQRPVRLLDCPPMSNAYTKKHPQAFDQQADSIARAIDSVDSGWSGLVHVTRKAEAQLLADRLARRGLQDRVWVPPLVNKRLNRAYGTQEQAALWQERLAQVPNSIMVCWQFWAGYDGRQERMAISAKVPYPFYGDEYERERLKVDKGQYNLRAALKLMQGSGRSRRGDPGDYDQPELGVVNGLVAVADGSLGRIKSFLSQSFVDALVPWS